MLIAGGETGDVGATSANRSGDPIVTEKRPDDYAINHPELQAWIEITHRPLIEIDDSARR